MPAAATRPKTVAYFSALIIGVMTLTQGPNSPIKTGISLAYANAAHRAESRSTHRLTLSIGARGR